MKRWHVLILMLAIIAGAYRLGYTNGLGHAYSQFEAYEQNNYCDTDLDCEQKAQEACERIYAPLSFYGKHMSAQEREQAIEECTDDTREGAQK